MRLQVKRELAILSAVLQSLRLFSTSADCPESAASESVLVLSRLIVVSLFHAAFDRAGKTYLRAKHSTFRAAQVVLLLVQETKAVLEKLYKYIGKNIKNLIDRPDEPYCLRLHSNRVYYVRESLMRRATNVCADGQLRTLQQHSSLFMANPYD